MDWGELYCGFLLKLFTKPYGSGVIMVLITKMSSLATFEFLKLCEDIMDKKDEFLMG